MSSIYFDWLFQHDTKTKKKTQLKLHKSEPIETEIWECPASIAERITSNLISFNACWKFDAQHRNWNRNENIAVSIQSIIWLFLKFRKIKFFENIITCSCSFSLMHKLPNYKRIWTSNFKLLVISTNMKCINSNCFCFLMIIRIIRPKKCIVLLKKYRSPPLFVDLNIWKIQFVSITSNNMC